MAIIKLRNRIEEYRMRAHMGKLNEMSGRSGREDLTQFVARSILDELRDVRGVIVDIGCGDGTLLQLFSQQNQITKCIGILPTKDEVSRLSSALDQSSDAQKIEVLEGLSAAVPLDSDYADAIVINGVIHILEDSDDVSQTLSEISRVSRNGGIIFLGEIPFRDETIHASQYGDSVVKWLIHILRERGLRAFFVKLFWVFKCLLGQDDMLIKPKNFLIFEPDALVRRLQAHGIEPLRIVPHKEVGTDGSVYNSKTRMDYVLISRK